MRIMYVTDALAIWGGLERILIDKSSLLSDMYGYDVTLVTLNQGFHPIPYKMSSKVMHVDLNIRSHQQYNYHGIRRLLKMRQLTRLYKERIRNIIQDFKPDVIVCVRSKLVRTIIDVKGGIPLIYESHTLKNAPDIIGFDSFTFLKTKLKCWNEKYAEVIVTLTEGDAKNWRTINPNVCVIPNVVNLNRSDKYCDWNAKSVIFVGRFSVQKDIRSLLNIWEIVYRKNPDWQLHLYGGYGGEQDLLLPEIQKNDINIIVHDPTPNIFEKYKESSIFLITSLFEPFGLVMPEAMSCGLPVVAFDCPYGPADIVTDGKDGFLIKDRDIRQYAEKVCLLMENVSLRQEMGQAGIISSQRYSAQRIMPKWKQLFEQLVENNR